MIHLLVQIQLWQFLNSFLENVLVGNLWSFFYSIIQNDLFSVLNFQTRFLIFDYYELGGCQETYRLHCWPPMCFKRRWARTRDYTVVQKVFNNIRRKWKWRKLNNFLQTKISILYSPFKPWQPSLKNQSLLKRTINSYVNPLKMPVNVCSGGIIVWEEFVCIFTAFRIFCVKTLLQDTL